MSGRNRTSFSGSSAAEAEDFIQAVRRTAWAEQKQFDYKWMAAYAATQMSGQALRWHMSLPQVIQGDWSKLEVALLDRFAPNQPPATMSNNPTVPSGASAMPALCVGRIKVMYKDTRRFLGYVPKEVVQGPYSIVVTTNVDDALLVQFTPSSSPVAFDLVDKSEFHRLALRVSGDSLELSSAFSSSNIRLICLAPGPKPGSIRYSDTVSMGSIVHHQTDVWKLGADGSITAVWPPSPEAGIGVSVQTRPKDKYKDRMYLPSVPDPTLGRRFTFMTQVEKFVKDDSNWWEHEELRLEFQHA